jgi:hypothetical protein
VLRTGLPLSQTHGRSQKSTAHKPERQLTECR